ncbi:MAG: (Fe-S)-binding protein [Deltaproteobacteria bacterium]|nr:(Fe-S)-binding protein [Deltaproteobacteria bacterium]
MINQGEMEESVTKFITDALNPCVKCHMCNVVCPICENRITQGPFGISRSIYYGLKWGEYNEEFRNLVYSCTTCGKCDIFCKSASKAVPLVEVIETAREYLLVDKMQGPMPEQVAVLKNMHIRGNPWGNLPHERTKWTEGLDIPFVSKEHKVDMLYFVGCACSYDAQGQKIAKNLSKILKRSGVSFGILENEICSGHEAKRMGETGLFAYLSESNMAMFKEAGVEHIVTGDPHSFYSFSREYPQQWNSVKVYHYTQFLSKLIGEGKLKLSTKIEKTVTYHDPCYLGRHSEVFEEPRNLIRSIPGVTLVEMEHVRADSDCCGIGGGRMWMEPHKSLLSSQAIADRRVRQALDTGAEILLTACPFCNITLNDSVKSLDKEDIITVMDISELVLMSL